MNPFFTSLGGVFLAVALFFLPGLLQPLARFFYPTLPSVRVRAAAPVLFALLAFACFAGFGLYACCFTVVVGGCQIARSRSKRRKVKPSQP